MPAQIPDRDLENSVSVRPNNQSIVEHLEVGSLIAQIPGSQQSLQNLFQFEGEFTVFISQARLQGIKSNKENYGIQFTREGNIDAAKYGNC